jgi:hypothetical protein
MTGRHPKKKPLHSRQERSGSEFTQSSQIEELPAKRAMRRYSIERHEAMLLPAVVDPGHLRKVVLREACRRSLMAFVRMFWRTVEPRADFCEGWWLEALAIHLEAVTDGKIKRLICNVAPGSMKSLMTNVFWPAWEWGPMGMASTRYVAVSYSSGLTERDNQRMSQVVLSQL